MRAHLLVLHADGSDEVHPIPDGEVVVGSGAAATIRVLAAPDLEERHFALSLRKEGCWIGVAQGSMTPVLKDGQPLVEAIVPWGSVLTIGKLSVAIHRGTPRPKGEKEADGSSRTRVMAMLFMTALLGLLALRARGNAAAGLTGIEPSPLFDAPAQCDAAGDVALTRGRESYDEAMARGQRFFYDYQDGVEAVRLLERADACLRIGGDVEASERARTATEVMRGRVEGTYHALRLRLRQDLDSHDDEAAMATLGELRELVSHREDAYTRELADLEREVRLRLGVLEATTTR